MPRAIGLDIGSHAVRAAAVRVGRPSETVGFGQVGLPRGAVEHGEIIDPGLVASALRRLWRDAHLRDRQVRVGLASQRTIIRQVEMPAMGEAELRSALEFQAGEFIPLPPEETYLDFKVVEPFTSSDGEDMLRILIAAIHRDTLQTALTAVREAGLQTVSFDLTPFALTRALVPQPGGEDTETAEAIISVGSGVTIVVVHEQGVIRFVRIVGGGGDDFTAAIEQALGLGFEDAEALKRQLSGVVDRRDEAVTAVEGPVANLLNEIRGSIDFYSAQPGARSLSRALLTGGGSLLHGFAQRLADTMGIAAELADVAATASVGDIGFAPEQLGALQPYLPAPVGLALGVDKGALYRFNLLSERERRVFSVGRAAAVGAAAGVLVVGGLAAFTMQRNNELSATKERLADQQATNQQIQDTIAGLQGTTDLQAESDQAQALIAAALTGEVAWSRVLQELARVIPGDVWLDSLQTSATSGVTIAPTDPAAVASGLGTLTFAATGIDYPSAAGWLQRLATLPSIRAPWVSSLAEGSVTIGATEYPAVTFSSNAILTDAAITERARRAARVAGTSPTAAPSAPAPATTETTVAAG
ncbi:MAG TPA: type IV pilus assembly protein PilM [Acidimicrobiia bacterium]|nr:type IV pilus assembly protein PilM [Acidimicrobiia bacterium]